MSYAEVMDRVASAAVRSGRRPEEVAVVAVSKTKSVEEIAALYDLGHRDFGENRAQELAAKAPHLPDDIRWHFVGALQSNKARMVRPIAHLLHSMDRRSLAGAWLKGQGAPPPVLTQVNVGDESQKSGLDRADLRDAIAWMIEVGLTVRGLMALPPAPETAEDSRRYFVMLRELLDEVSDLSLDLDQLSMGMTDDFEVAIEEGASIIRVGRAIFGPRN